MNRKAIWRCVGLLFWVSGALFPLCGPAWAADTRLTETENGYYYTVQKGDTLWGLSQRFADAPWVWPELWEENSRIIANPHLIYPGQKLRLARLKGRPVAGATAAAPSLEGIHYYYALADQYGFIRKVPVAPQGVVFKSRDTRLTMISEGDIVYIQPQGGAALAKGSLFTVYRTFEPIVDKASRQLIGTQHLLCGLVEILQREPEYAVGRVVKSYRPITLGDKLMPYEKRPIRIPVQKSEPGIDAVILLAEQHLDMMAELNVAFMDRGAANGIQPGQVYSIYYRDEHNLGTTLAPKRVTTPVDYGELIVLHVEENTATVLITDSDKEFFAGTRVRTPLAAN